MPKHPGGRPSSLTPEVTKKLLDAIRMGNYYNAACAYAGINYDTFRRWMGKGEQAKSGEFYEFFVLVGNSEHEAEARIVGLWVKQIPEDWHAAQAFLERRYPDRWGKKETKIIEGGDEDKPIRLSFLKVKLDEITED